MSANSSNKFRILASGAAFAIALASMSAVAFAQYQTYPPYPPQRPEDRAFDPREQASIPAPPIERVPVVERLGLVPITAGPNVPLVELSNLRLGSTQRDNWRLSVTLTNNSAEARAPVFICHFMNGGRTVSRARVVSPMAAPGEQMRLTIMGPDTQLFVDKARCDLVGA